MEVLERRHTAIPDCQLGLVRQDRLDQTDDVRRLVLIVRVSVHDDVGAVQERRLESSTVRRREPTVTGESHDVVDAIGACDRRRLVPAPVVDDEVFDRVDAGQGPRQVHERGRQRRRFVVAGNLDDDFDHRGSRTQT